MIVVALAVLASLAGCDLLQGLRGGYTVSGTISFSSFTRSVGGDFRIQLFSTIDASGGPVADLAPRVYSGEQQVSYAFAGIKPGDYRVQGFIDRNANGVWEEGEPVGGYPFVAAGQPALMSVKQDTVMDLAIWANPIPITTVSGVSGAMPLFAVTKISDTDIPPGWDPAYALSGAPIIITPGIAPVPDRSRNIAQAGRGIIAMGSGGAGFLDVVSLNWAAWGFTGQPPVNIGMGNSIAGSAARRDRCSVGRRGVSYPRGHWRGRRSDWRHDPCRELARLRRSSRSSARAGSSSMDSNNSLTSRTRGQRCS